MISAFERLEQEKQRREREALSLANKTEDVGKVKPPEGKEPKVTPTKVVVVPKVDPKPKAAPKVEPKAAPKVEPKAAVKVAEKAGEGMSDLDKKYKPTRCDERCPGQARRVWGSGFRLCGGDSALRSGQASLVLARQSQDVPYRPELCMGVGGAGALCMPAEYRAADAEQRRPGRAAAGRW